MELTNEEVAQVEKWERKKDEGRYMTCWACGERVLRKRIEEHHVIRNSDMTIPLCVLCHDVVDRMDLTHPNIFYEFMDNVMKEFTRLIKDGNKDYKWLKIYTLKTSKIIKEYLMEKQKKKEDEQSLVPKK